VFTPHVAFNSVEAVKRINEVTVANIRAFFAGKPINVVNSLKSGEGVHSTIHANSLAFVCR
jgi:phosphoglycerate dehydrogenase-like enzyme